MEEGWYLMSTADLERELARRRDPMRELPPSNAERLSIQEALSYRNAGNLRDDLGRTLRLVLIVDDPNEVGRLGEKRLRYEPDFHDPPTWRRPGSAKVTVVPLRATDVPRREVEQAWWEDPAMRDLEAEWRARGTVAGMMVPGEWRGFVFKTVVALRAAGREVTPQTVGDSVARWLLPEDAARLRAALIEANQR